VKCFPPDPNTKAKIPVGRDENLVRPDAGVPPEAVKKTPYTELGSSISVVPVSTIAASPDPRVEPAKITEWTLIPQYRLYGDVVVRWK
jgi:hypothetical protein